MKQISSILHLCVSLKNHLTLGCEDVLQNHPTYDALYHPPAGGGRENFGPRNVRIWVTTVKITEKVSKNVNF